MSLIRRHPSRLLGIWKIEETASELLDLLEKKELYTCSLQNFRTENRKKEWLATRVLLKELLGQELQIAYWDDGSPYLPENPDMRISISHTKGYVAVYCSQEKRVGVDIEYHSERVVKIQKKFLSEEELAGIDLANEAQHLLICWCAKETLFKLIRQTEVDFCRHLHIEPFLFKKEGDVQVWETKTSKAEIFKLSYIITPEFIVAYSL